MMTDINIFIAFGAGVLSFVSPCVLPLYPAFLSYITGMSVEGISKENKMLNRKSMIHTILFLLGFSSIFIILCFRTSFEGELLNIYLTVIRQIWAMLVIFYWIDSTSLCHLSLLIRCKAGSSKSRPA